MSNMTDLFKKERTGLPSSSESFWTSLFALYILHLGKIGGELKVWERLATGHAPWYGPRKTSSLIHLAGLKFEDISIEPTHERTARYFASVAGLLVEDAGFSPDILLHRSSAAPQSGPTCIVIENKLTEKLQKNQIENYPRLLGALEKKGIKAELLLLTFMGSEPVDKQASTLKERLGNQLGLLLWEDVIREMTKRGFALAGVDFLQLDTDDLDKDAVWANQAAG